MKEVVKFIKCVYWRESVYGVTHYIYVYVQGNRSAIIIYERIVIITKILLLLFMTYIICGPNQYGTIHKCVIVLDFIIFMEH